MRLVWILLRSLKPGRRSLQGRSHRQSHSCAHQSLLGWWVQSFGHHWPLVCLCHLRLLLVLALGCLLARCSFHQLISGQIDRRRCQCSLGLGAVHRLGQDLFAVVLQLLQPAAHRSLGSLDAGCLGVQSFSDMRLFLHIFLHHIHDRLDIGRQWSCLSVDPCRAVCRHVLQA